MQKLQTFVEESRVVLVAFEDEVFALSQLKTAAKVFRHSADQERRLQSRCMKNPCKHGSRRGLAMSACDHEHFFAAQKLIVKNLWQRTKRDAMVEHMFQFHIAARDSIA